MAGSPGKHPGSMDDVSATAGRGGGNARKSGINRGRRRGQGEERGASGSIPVGAKSCQRHADSGVGGWAAASWSKEDEGHSGGALLGVGRCGSS